MLGSMVAMSAALSSCCCNKREASYRQNQQNVYATAPRVEYGKGSATTYTPTPTVQYQQPIQQPIQQVAPRNGGMFSQVQPVPVAQPRQVVYVPAQRQQPAGQVIVVRESADPVGITGGITSDYCYARSNDYYGGCYGSRYYSRVHSHGGSSPRRCTYGTVGNLGGFLGGHRHR